MNKRELLCSVVLVCFVVLAGGSAQAAPGELDPSFGSGGTVTTTVGTAEASASALVLLPDRKLVAAGISLVSSTYDFALARYEPNGSLDPTFGASGTVTTPIGTGTDSVLDVALQTDGKIVAVGTSEGGGTFDFALARYNPNGSLDTTFGIGGKVRTSLSSSQDIANAVALQPDGKIVAAGSTAVAGTEDDFALVRYNADGSRDTGFGAGGVVTTAISVRDDEVSAVVLQPDGKIVAAGNSLNGSDVDFALARYNPDGSLDTSFGVGGKVTTPIGSSDSALAVVLQPDGKIVAGGFSGTSADFDFALARYHPNGSLDSAFGTNGKVTTAIGSASVDVARDLVLQPDGRIAATGASSVGATGDFAVARYNPDGSLDTGFGAGGKLTTAIGTDEGANASELQPDGKLVSAGFTCNGGSCGFALVRYLGSTLTVVKTGSGTGTITSGPAGIDCGSTCSAPLAAVPVKLTATPSPGSRFAGWSGDCSGTGPCSVTMSSDRSATATFDTIVRCVAPKLRGKKLTRAKRTVRAAHCSVGKVTRAFSRKVKKGKVISQQPKPGTTRSAGSKVKLKVSKGKRRRGSR